MIFVLAAFALVIVLLALVIGSMCLMLRRQAQLYEIHLDSVKENATMLLNIKDYVKAKKEKLKENIEYFFKDSPPQLAIIQVGNVEASNRYVTNKIKDCAEVGIIAHRYGYDEEITEEELLWEVEDLCKHYNGVIVQLPLPDHISAERVAAAITPIKDVDGFHPMSWYKPATPLGIMNYLRDCGFDFDGAHVVIIGRSEIVGKPLAQMMTNENATVTLCHSHTKRLWDHIRSADLVVSAVGKANFLNCYSIHVPVVDVGINFNEEGKLCGDCFNVEDREVTPVPGGVGLLTRLALLENTYKARVAQNDE